MLPVPLDALGPATGASGAGGVGNAGGGGGAPLGTWFICPSLLLLSSRCLVELLCTSGCTGFKFGGTALAGLIATAPELEGACDTMVGELVCCR